MTFLAKGKPVNLVAKANKNLCLVNCDRLAKQFDLALLLGPGVRKE